MFVEIQSLNSPYLSPEPQQTLRNSAGAIRRLLGHKGLSSTQIYVNMEKLIFGKGSNKYVVKVATTVEELQSLLRVGFEYVTDFQGKKILRKRK